jgi:alcohol dehydrogenase
MSSKTYRSWILPKIGAPLHLEDRSVPEPRPDGVLVRVERATILSYMAKVIDGTLAFALPPFPFVPGTNAIGRVEKVGCEVTHVSKGERVFLSPHLVDTAPTDDPSQILIGLTAMSSRRFEHVSDATRRLQLTWRDGVFTEIAHWPADCVTSLRDLEHHSADRLIALAKMIVPYGGMLKAGTVPGDTIIINGANGYFGSAAVAVALALGAARVIAVGRDGSALKHLAETLGARVVPVTIAGTNQETDLARLRDAIGGTADRAVDHLGHASSTSTTLSVLRSLRRGGRLVLMGSAAVPLELPFGEMLSNEWEVVGCFMYPKYAPAKLTKLVASGSLDLSKVRIKKFFFDNLPQAIQAAASMRDLDCVVLSSAAE